MSLPDLEIASIKAKVDTGARTSALHAFRVEAFSRGGSEWIRFALHPLQNRDDCVLEVEAPVKDRRLVRDSGGHSEMRYVIETRIQIGDRCVTSEITLTDRDTMKFRMLLGRTTLKQGYIVDPSRSYLSGGAAGEAGPATQETPDP